MARTENKNRYLLAAAVAGLHIVVIVIVIEVQSQAPHPYTEPTTAMRVFLTQSRRPHAFPAPTPLRQALIIAPITPEIRGPGLSTGPNAVHIEIPRAINWAASARRAVATVLERKTKRAFGFPKGADPFRTLKGSSDDSMPHAGQSYRARGGRRLAWVSKHCYLVSSPPSLGASQLQRQARMSSIGCKDSGGSSASQSFIKRLRAYERDRREQLRRYEVARPNHGP